MAGDNGPITALFYYRETGSDYYDFGCAKPARCTRFGIYAHFSLNPCDSGDLMNPSDGRILGARRRDFRRGAVVVSVATAGL
jgi:hypothetical protein